MSIWQKSCMASGTAIGGSVTVAVGVSLTGVSVRGVSVGVSDGCVGSEVTSAASVASGAGSVTSGAVASVTSAAGVLGASEVAVSVTTTVSGTSVGGRVGDGVSLVAVTIVGSTVEVSSWATALRPINRVVRRISGNTNLRRSVL